MLADDEAVPEYEFGAILDVKVRQSGSQVSFCLGETKLGVTTMGGYSFAE